MARSHSFTAALHAAALAAISLFWGPAVLAKSPATYTLACSAAPGVANADSLCASFAGALAQAGWEGVTGDPAVAIHMAVAASGPTSLRLVLTLTAPDGRTQTIDRALSAADTTLSSTMQARFLQSLVSAIPSDF